VAGKKCGSAAEKIADKIFKNAILKSSGVTITSCCHSLAYSPTYHVADATLIHVHCPLHIHILNNS